MSHAQITPRRLALLSAALLSIAALAGCQTKAVTETSGSSVASTDDSGVVEEDSFPALEHRLASVGDRVHFALDRYDLSPEAEATLQQQAALLKDYQAVAITIEGHADERGTREYNLALGERRADTVRNYPMALGIPGDRISVVSYGKERPQCPAADEGCWFQNRRGVTVASQ